MKELILEFKKVREEGVFTTNTYTLEITEEIFKEFQSAIIKGVNKDTNVFFKLED